MPRCALFERLAEAERAVQVSAPAGSGKTVLIRSSIAEAGLARHAAWVPVDSEAGSPGRAGSPAMSTTRRQARRLPIPAAWPARSGQAAHPWAIVSAGLAPILLTGAYLVAGILQPASYSPVRTTISAMAGQAGTDRWVMTGGIFLVGGCYLVTAAGLTGVRAAARALLVVAGVAGIGIAASPEPARGATPWHLAWTVLGAVTIAVWPAFAARRASPRQVILSACGSAAVTVVFVALLGWLLAETRDGSVLGLAERLTSSIQTCWPFMIAVALRRTWRPHPVRAIGGSGGVKDSASPPHAPGGRSAEHRDRAGVWGQAGESPGSGDGCSPCLVIRLQEAIRRQTPTRNPGKACEHGNGV